MKSELKNKIKFWGMLAVAGAGVVGIFLLPASSVAARSKPAPHEVVAVNPDSLLAQAAARVFHGPSCAGCHYLTGIWGHDGVALDFAGVKYDAATLRRYIRNPKSVDEHSLMPPQDNISEAGIDAIANFLAGLSGPGTNSSHEHR
jgi:mono/diheme cytochrome c family protein